MNLQSENKTRINQSYSSLRLTLLFLAVLMTISEQGYCLKPFYKSPLAKNRNIGSASDSSIGSDGVKGEGVKNNFSARPVLFTENKGQMTDIHHKPVPYVLFRAEATNMNVYITTKGLTYVFLKKVKAGAKPEPNGKPDVSSLLKSELSSTEMSWLDVQLKGGKIRADKIIKEERSVEHYNYFSGHCPQGIYDVYRYGKITIKDVYPGIDWVFYNSERNGMKYDFVLHPGADPAQIKLLYKGDYAPELQQDGSISIKTQLGTLAEARPFSFEADRKMEISSSYKISGEINNQTLIEFEIGKYDRSKIIIIDPQLSWFTFFGGTDWDECLSSTTDLNGNLYLTGYTQSTNFPVQNPGSGAYFSGTFGSGGIEADVFIIKFSPSGALLWATYYSGSDFEVPYFASHDQTGHIYVSGITSSQNFPVLNPGSGAYFQQNLGGDHDAFILKFDQNGNRLWATYYGGSQYDGAFGMSVDPAGHLLVSGKTSSTNFPTQNSGGFFQANLSGTSDAFILKFDPNGIRQWASFYGGSDTDEAHAVDTDDNGNIFLSGETNSNDFPIQGNGTFLQASNAGLTDIFIVKFDANNNRQWASYYGGVSFDLLFSIALDSQGSIHLTGTTESLNFPTQNAGSFFQGIFNGGFTDLFFLKFDANGNRLWSTFFGGNGNYESYYTFDVLESDECGNIYFSGVTDDTPFPHTQNNVNAPFFDNSGNIATMANEVLLGRFSSDGLLHWCSYLNGSGNEQRNSVAVDRKNYWVYSIASTIPQFMVPYSAANFPLTNPGGGAYFDNTIDPSGGDGYEITIAKFTIPSISVSSSSVQATNCTSCDGSATVTISQGEGPFTFEWSNGQFQSSLTNPTATITGLCPGNYSAIVRAACGRPDTVNFNITSLTGGSASSQITVSSCSFYTAPWGSVYTQSGSYSDTLTAANGCDSVITLNLTINDTFLSVENITECGSYTTASGITYSQSGIFSDTLVSANGCDSILTLNLTIESAIQSQESLSSCGPYTAADGSVFSQNATFTSTYLASNGCDSIVTYNLSVLPVPSTSLSLSDISIEPGDSVQIFVTGGDSYQWSPPDGLSCANCPNPIASPQTTTIFVVNTTNTDGCSTSDSIQIKVDIRCDEFFIPDIFTPNAEGPSANEKLCAFSNCVRLFSFIIYNRWGEQVFEASDINNCWDGTYKGKEAQSGLYAYKLYLEKTDGEILNKSGLITLIR
jgi:gliding motility-associated-like protein